MSAPHLFDLPEPTPAAAGPAAASGGGLAQTQALYRKYRPQTFDAAELVGQEHIVQTLRNAIRLDRIAHAYLFCGPRGTGKTTTARLLAKAVNCLDPDPDRRPCGLCASCRAIGAGSATDVIEIDAASNRGIDDIRELRERVKYAPAQLRVKFYIIDEAHQITGPAANAFLKTLEEPPLHTKFVLATTDPEELLATIVSRCQRFDFRRLPQEAVMARLRTVAEAEGLAIEPEAVATIARHATGSLRDALGLLDQLSVYGDAGEDGERPTITVEAVRALLGVSRNDRVEALAEALAARDVSLALGTVNAAVEAGEDPRALNRQLVGYLRILLHERAGGSPDADARARDLAPRFELLDLAELARRFSEVDYRIRHAPYGQLPLEIALVEGILRPAAADRATVAPTAAPPAPAPVTGAGQRETRQADDAELYAKPPTTALRDRLRSPGSAPHPPASSSPAPSPNPAAPAPSAPEPRGGLAESGPSATAAAPPGPANGAAGVGSLNLEQLVDLWPRIRQDVKAVNRRIEALLSSIDPLAVQGSQITLAAAYDFHRNRLNTDEVRMVVEETIGRLIGSPVQVTCVLRGETPPNGGRPAPAAAPVPPSNGPPALAEPAVEPELAAAEPATAVPSLPDEDRRVDAAKNLFDAEEIDPE
jgi:DNA polymerase III subunit gamma/tau